VAKQFEALKALAAGSGDGFDLPAKWAAAVAEVRKLDDIKPVAKPAAPVDVVAEQWKQSKKLSGFVNITDPERAAALVNGRMVRLGQVLDGLTLKSVDNKEGFARFEDPSGRVVVKLRMPGSDNNGPDGDTP
jgi:hypothetical protein